MPSADPAALRARCVFLPWRGVFIVYALAMMVGIHWPRLHIGVGDVPGPDKILHFIAFGGLTFFLWTTGWFPRLLILWLLMMVWTYLAELTQAIPILGRTFSWQDIIGGWLGVTSVTLWLWACSPIGGTHNRLRLRFNTFIVQHLFTRPRNWMATGGAGLVVSIIIGACTGAMMYAIDPTRPKLAVSAALLGWLVGGVAGVFGTLDALVRRSRDAVADLRPCFDCGAQCGDSEINENGGGRCDRCGGSLRLGQWIMRPHLPRSAIVRCMLFPTWIVLVVALPMGVLWYAYTQPNAPLSGVHTDMRVAGAVAMLSAGLAFATRFFRRNIARLIDAQSERCRWCGHDVHATPTVHGIGRCGECGTPFVRL